MKNLKTVLNVSRIANLHYFEFTPNFETKDDKHPFYELVYVDSGTLGIHSDHFSGILKQNQMILHTPNETHSLLCPPDAAPNIIIIGFECKSKYAQEQLKIFSARPAVLMPFLSKLLAEIVMEGREVFLPPYDVPNLADMKKRPKPMFGSDHLLKNLLELFLIKLIREEKFKVSEKAQSNRYSHFISRVLAYIHQNYREKITIDDLSFLFGTNRTTLCKSFKEETGYSIIEYVNQERIKAAKRIIREGDKNFSQISEELNFPTQAYFTRIFQKTEGMTPSDYIKTIKSKLE